MSNNPKFCISALKRFVPEDFLNLLKKHKVEYEIKNETQLFCKRSSRELLDALLTECGGVQFKFGCRVDSVDWMDTVDGMDRTFRVRTNQKEFSAKNLVVATGGLSYPQLGATDLGFKIAKQFGHTIIPPRPALVSLAMGRNDRALFGQLSGVSLPVTVKYGKKSFTDSLLFTHKALSGPAIHNVSLYAKPGETIEINLCPQFNLEKYLKDKKAERPKALVKTILSEVLPHRLVDAVKDRWFLDGPMNEIADAHLVKTAHAFEHWQFASEKIDDFSEAIVTAGGVDTHELSSKTMESLHVKGLYFIGEVVDVTGEEGGYNLHWAWASGWCAGNAIGS